MRKNIEGTDFEIKNGMILLHTETSVISRGAGDPLVDPSSQQISLAPDVDGVYKNGTVAAGLVFLIIPVVISDITEIRFARKSGNKSYNYCSSC